MKKKKGLLLLAIVLHAVLILLMALPIGAVLRFAPSPEERVYRSFAYFNLGVLGMSGNPFPFLTAVLTSVAFLLLLVLAIRGGRAGRLGTACLACTAAAAVCSVPAQLMTSRASIAGIAVSLLLAASVVIQRLLRQREMYGES